MAYLTIVAHFIQIVNRSEGVNADFGEAEVLKQG